MLHRVTVCLSLTCLLRYNPENLATLERYVETQAKENAYDLEANLAILKLYDPLPPLSTISSTPPSVAHTHTFFF